MHTLDLTNDTSLLHLIMTLTDWHMVIEKENQSYIAC
jgi:hypothetical protein